MNRPTLNPETLSVESFETAPAAAAGFAAPTHRCDTRLTICTIGPEIQDGKGWQGPPGAVAALRARTHRRSHYPDAVGWAQQ